MRNITVLKVDRDLPQLNLITVFCSTINILKLYTIQVTVKIMTASKHKAKPTSHKKYNLTN